MTTKNYIVGRKTYRRPQGLLFSDNPGNVINSVYVPQGEEFDEFIVLSDDNRKPIQMSTERIEDRKRMINGTMRSYHIADKLKLQTSWENLPSRAFDVPGATAINQTTGKPTLATLTVGVADNDPTPQPRLLSSQRFTTDGGAGGADLLNWYKTHPGPFWVYMAYDNYYNFSDQTDPWVFLGQYNERIQMYFTEFSYEVLKRGVRYDLWTVSMSLEEV